MWLLDRNTKEKENNFSLGFTDLRTSTWHLRSPPRVWAAPTRFAPARQASHPVALPFHSLTMERIPVRSFSAGPELLENWAWQQPPRRVCTLRFCHCYLLPTWDFSGVTSFGPECQVGTVGTVVEAETQRRGVASQGHTTYVTELGSSPGVSTTWAPGANRPVLWGDGRVCISCRNRAMSSGVIRKLFHSSWESSLFPVSQVNRNRSHFPSGVGACSVPCAPVRSTVKWKMRLMFQIVQFPNYALIIHIKQVKWPLTET